MKEKPKKFNVLEIILSQLEGTLNIYHFLLFFNLILISNPKKNIDFPIRHFNAEKTLKDLGITKEIDEIDPFEAIIQLSKKNIDYLKIDELKKELEKEVEDIDDLDIFAINIKDKESILKINECFYKMDIVLQKAMAQQHEKPLPVIIMDVEEEGFISVYDCVYLALHLLARCSEWMGYWTAKMEKEGKESRRGCNEKKR